MTLATLIAEARAAREAFCGPEQHARKQLRDVMEDSAGEWLALRDAAKVVLPNAMCADDDGCRECDGFRALAAALDALESTVEGKQ